MAFVFYASLSLSAILILILFIGTRVSVLLPLISVGAFLAVTDGVGGAAGAGFGGPDGAAFGGAAGAAGAGVAAGVA